MWFKVGRNAWYVAEIDCMIFYKQQILSLSREDSKPVLVKMLQDEEKAALNIFSYNSLVVIEHRDVWSCRKSAPVAKEQNPI